VCWHDVFCMHRYDGSTFLDRGVTYTMYYTWQHADVHYMGELSEGSHSFIIRSQYASSRWGCGSQYGGVDVLVFEGCSAVQPPLGGRIEAGSCQYPNEGDSCIIRCLPGFTRTEGMEERYCTSGEWPGEDVECSIGVATFPSPPESYTLNPGEDADMSVFCGAKDATAYWWLRNGKMFQAPLPMPEARELGEDALVASLGFSGLLDTDTPGGCV
jgi:hypothetical protein